MTASPALPQFRKADMCLHTHPCLFCDDRERQQTSEHILQKGFGSSWTLPNDVCTKCNSEIFSPLDNSLIDFADRLVYPHHPEVLSKRMLLQAGHTVSYDEESGIWESVRIDRDSRPVILSQLIVVGSNSIRIVLDPRAGDDWRLQVEQIKRELSNPENVSFKELIFDQPDPSRTPVQPAVIRSQKNKYLLRGATQEEVARLKEQIMDGQLLLNMGSYSEPEYIAQRTSIYSKSRIDVEGIDRALAKSAVNAVCACLGPDRARQPALKRIKSFVLGELPYRKDEFVEHWWGIEELDTEKADTTDLLKHRKSVLTQIYGKAGNHTVVLLSLETPKVLFFLYGELFAIVKLTENTDFLHRDESTTVLLDYKAKTYEIYRLPRDIERFAMRFFSRLP